jgi:hypothetical protein
MNRAAPEERRGGRSTSQTRTSAFWFHLIADRAGCTEGGGLGAGPINYSDTGEADFLPAPPTRPIQTLQLLAAGRQRDIGYGLVVVAMAMSSLGVCQPTVCQVISRSRAEVRSAKYHYLAAETLVRDTGIEPVTSSVSGKRSPAELIALGIELEVETGIEPVCTALQAVASPLGHSTAGVDATCTFERMTGFEPATLTLAR